MLLPEIIKSHLKEKKLMFVCFYAKTLIFILKSNAREWFNMVSNHFSPVSIFPKSVYDIMQNKGPVWVKKLRFFIKSDLVQL